MTQAITDLAVLKGAIATPAELTINGVPHVAVPAGYELKSMETLLTEPRRITCAATAHKVEGFIDYVKRFKDARTALYCGPEDAPKLLARLDDHRPEAPSQVTHTVAFACPRTVEWLAWVGKNKTAMPQVEFAEFIEANIRDIIEPDGAGMLKTVLDFQDHGTAEFKSAVRLESGRMQFKYVEKEAGEIQFPSTLKIAIPVFQGDTGRYPIVAKLRYRIKDQALSLWYELDRPDLVLRQAYADLLVKVSADTGLLVHQAL